MAPFVAKVLLQCEQEKGLSAVVAILIAFFSSNVCFYEEILQHVQSKYFSNNQVDLSLSFAVIIIILQLMLIPLSYEHQKLSNFYKRNLAFVNRAFILPMGLRGSERDGREGIQNNVIDDLPSLEI